MTCTIRKCPPVTCKDPIRKEGSCCLSCPGMNYTVENLEIPPLLYPAPVPLSPFLLCFFFMRGLGVSEQSIAPGYFYVSAPPSSRFKSPLQHSRHPQRFALRAYFKVRSSASRLFFASLKRSLDLPFILSPPVPIIVF